MTPPIPLNAWDQAVIVVLFSVLLLSLLGGLLAFAGKILSLIQRISLQFQDFIKSRDDQWQSYFEQRELSFRERNNEVVEVLRKLVQQFDAHDTLTRDAIARMDERTRNYPAPGTGHQERSKPRAAND